VVRSLAMLLVAIGLVACSADASPGDDIPIVAKPPQATEPGAPPPPPAPKEPETPPAPVVPVNPRWQKFLDGRNDALAALAQPILTCVARFDTSSAAFHGCIDWHSAVHGTWALLALSRLTKDPKYAQATATVLDPALLANELATLKRRGSTFEVPYGYAWFLVLAGERAKQKKTDLVPLADHVVSLLDTWASGLQDLDLSTSLRADDYQNVSWAVQNVWQYAVDSGDTARANRMIDFVRTRLLPRDADCPLERDAAAQGFFPACLHRARALALMLPPAESKAWASTFLPKTYALAPVVTPAPAHQAGLNFSRSWDFFGLYKATGNEAYRDLYLDHMEAWLKRPDIWAGNYESHAHWVAQFGVYALSLSYE